MTQNSCAYLFLLVIILSKTICAAPSNEIFSTEASEEGAEHVESISKAEDEFKPSQTPKNNGDPPKDEKTTISSSKTVTKVEDAPPKGKTAKEGGNIQTTTTYNKDVLINKMVNHDQNSGGVPQEPVEKQTLKKVISNTKKVEYTPPSDVPRTPKDVIKQIETVKNTVQTDASIERGIVQPTYIGPFSPEYYNGVNPIEEQGSSKRTFTKERDQLTEKDSVKVEVHETSVVEKWFSWIKEKHEENPADAPGTASGPPALQECQNKEGLCYHNSIDVQFGLKIEGVCPEDYSCYAIPHDTL